MCIRRSAVSLAIAAVLIACLANIALAQTSVTIPPSSFANPSDAGVRSHTNIQIGPLHGGTPEPNGGPPYPGLFYEDPASLACIYGLTLSPWSFPGLSGCNPNNPSLNNPSGGSQA